jgi:nicotinamide riboside kinase
MKIAIIGTHSTGKTTLIKKFFASLSECGYNPILIEEMSRLCPFPINEHTTAEAQIWIQENQILRENINHHDRIMVCDRGTIDNYAYFERAHPEIASAWRERAISHMRTYDIIFKTFKLNIVAKEDGTRSTNEQFRTDIDSRVVNLLNENDITFFQLPETYKYETHIDFIKEKIGVVIPNFNLACLNTLPVNA